MKTLNLIQFVRLAFTQGGGSFNLADGSVNPTEGYMVATKGNKKKVQIDILLKEGEIVKQLTKHAFRHVVDTYDAWAFNPFIYLQMWFNKEDGLWHFDICEQEHNLEDALKLGRERNMTSVWDCKSRIEIGIEFLKKIEGL